MSFLHKLLVKKNLKKRLYSSINQALLRKEKYYPTAQEKSMVSSFAKEAKTQLELFQLFMTDDFIEYIVACTQKENF